MTQISHFDVFARQALKDDIGKSVQAGDPYFGGKVSWCQLIMSFTMLIPVSITMFIYIYDMVV